MVYIIAPTATDVDKLAKQKKVDKQAAQQKKDDEAAKKATKEQKKPAPTEEKLYTIDVSNNNSSSPPGGMSFLQLLLYPLIAVVWFALGSWQLSLLIDQVKCHKGARGCLLPSNTDGLPYCDPSNKKIPSSGDVAGAGMSALYDITKLKFFSKIFNVKPKKNKRGSSSQKGGARRQKRYIQRGGNTQHGGDNILSSIDVNGFRPFDILNGPVQMPYSLAYEKAPWYEPGFLNFGKWFGHMQITAWSTTRMVLSGYLAAIGAFISTKNSDVNYWSRFFVTLAMPLILAVPIFMAPLVSFISCIWGMFKGGYNYLFAIIFFLCPFITVATMTVQHLSLLGYFLMGGLMGSGQQQLAQNFSSSSKGGYLGILQTLLLLLLLGLLILFIMGAAKKQGLMKSSADSTDESGSSSGTPSGTPSGS